MKLDKGWERGRGDMRPLIALLAPESESVGERGTLLVFLDWCIGHGAPPLTRCVVASLGASIRSSARRGAIIVAPAAGATVKGLSCSTAPAAWRCWRGCATSRRLTLIVWRTS